jgi:hypothetical protein
MMIENNNLKMMSLYDYLGKAAGSELGEKVYTEAIKQDVKVHVKEVSTRTYRGKIMMYPELFLKGYFSEK